MADKSSIESWLVNIIDSEKASIRSLDYIFVTDAFLHSINQKYLNHDTYTDIITFDLSDDKHKEGEIYISFERVQENAQKFGVSQETELKRVIVHGLLHLLGFQDHTEEQKLVMRSKEDYFLSKWPN